MYEMMGRGSEKSGCKGRVVYADLVRVFPRVYRIAYGRGRGRRRSLAPLLTLIVSPMRYRGFRVCRRMLFRSMCISVMIDIVARSEQRL